MGLICLLFTLWYSFSSVSTLQTSLFAYQRDLVDTGQWWRIFTAHFMHSNFIHFVVNIIGLYLLWLLHGEYSTPASFTINTLCLCAGISFCIYVWSPSIIWYVGLSGVLHGIFAWGVVVDIFFKRKTGYLLLFGLIIKLTDENFFSSSQFMSDLIEVSVATDAHLFGAIIGLILGIATVLIFPMTIKNSQLKNK